MNLINVLLLILLVGVIIFDSIMQSVLREKLRRADIEVMRLRGERDRMGAELHAALRREETKRYHQRTVRDERIKELEAKYVRTVNEYEEKLRIQEDRYQTLADISNKALSAKSGK